jgi:hypothetical protein
VVPGRGAAAWFREMGTTVVEPALDLLVRNGRFVR